MAKVVSIEIGYLVTRICEVEYKGKGHKVYKSFTVPTKEGIINDGVLSVTSDYVDSIRSALSKNKVSSKQVVFTISSAKIASREVMIPLVKENRIYDVVKANASEYFPVDLSQYQLAYSILGIEGEEKGNQKYKLLVLAAPTAMLTGYYDLAAELKLEVAAIDYVGNSLFQIIKDECDEGTNLIIKIDERNSLIMVVKSGRIIFTRSIAYGVDEALNEVRQDPERNAYATFEQAAEIAYEEDVTKSVHVKEALAPTIGAIARVVEFFVSRNQGENIDRVLITGMGADIVGFPEMIAEETNHEVEVVGKIPSLNLDKYFNTPHFNEYVTCVGAAVSPINFRREEEKKAVSSGSGSNSGYLIAGLICGLGVLAGIGLSVFAIYENRDAVKESKKLNAQVEQLQDIIPIYEEYIGTLDEYNKVTAIYDVTRNRNDDLELFFKELEQKMPMNGTIESFSCTQQDVIINILVKNKGEVAATIEQLRKFESLNPDSVTVTAMTVQYDEDDMPTAVEFVVSAQYRPVTYGEGESTESEGNAEE